MIFGAFRHQHVAVLRYFPVIGAARMPTRFSILVMLGVAAMLTFAVRALRVHARRRWLPAVTVASCLLIELLPAPRPLHHVRVPSFSYRTPLASGASSRPSRLDPAR